MDPTGAPGPAGETGSYGESAAAGPVGRAGGGGAPPGARPTTPADRRSLSGMVGAMLVTLLVLAAFIGFRALNRTNLSVTPQHVNYLAQVRYAQQAGSKVVYPSSLPAGWYATQVTVTPGTPTGLELSMLTPDSRYAGFVDSPQPLPEVLSTYVDSQAQPGPTVRVPGSVATRWATWTDGGGDTALAATRGHGATAATLLVFGTVTRGQLERLAAALTTAAVHR